MKTMHVAVTRALWMGLLALCFSAAPLSAQQSGIFTYSLSGGTVTITHCQTDAVGDVAIPAMIADKSVTSIGDRAFEGCRDLTSVAIPESVTSIGELAFLQCERLVTISLPNAVKFIGNLAFKWCTRLTAIEVGPLNNNYSSLDGVLFDKNRSTLIQFPRGKVGTYFIPNEITSIGDRAFEDCTGLTSVSVPNSVTSIGVAAFSECRGLTTVTLPSNATGFGAGTFAGCRRLTSVSIPHGTTEIGSRTFDGCRALASVTIPDGVTEIGPSAFNLCSSLTSVALPDSVTTIREFAFQDCTSLSSIFIPDAVTSIVGTFVFYGCKSLTGIEVGPGNVNYSSLDGALFDKSQTALLQYPEGKAGAYAIPDSVTAIAIDAFGSCTGLTSISIPDSITSIPQGAFFQCAGLTSVSIPDSVTSIGDSAFEQCTGLVSVTIPDSVTAIGYSAFESCTSLASVAIPGSVTSINYYAFLYCTSLTSISIPDSVTLIGSEAFGGCTALTSVALPPSVSTTGFGAFGGCTNLASVTIPEGVTYIDEGSFADCTALTSITIPDSVTSIGPGAFYGCTGLTAVSIGNGVTNIADSAFQDCTGLASITIPDGVTEFGWDAFHGCSGLASVSIGSGLATIGSLALKGWTGLDGIEVSPLNPYFSSLDGALFDKNRTALLKFPARTAETYAIPVTVATITSWAFEGCTGLTSVTIPASVTGVESQAFAGCTGLTNFTVDAANPAYGSLNGVLFDKSGTTLVRYPEGVAGAYAIPGTVAEIGYGAFYGCTGLTSVTIPDGVTSIGYGAFWDCTGLTSVNIPDAVTAIDSETFEGCTSLTAITIPDSVTSIGQAAFWDCSGLTSVTVPDNVTSIGYGAFWDCTGLTSVSIGRNVTDIAYRAFYGCTGLSEFTVDALNPTYRSIDGVLFNKSQTTLLQFPAQKAGHYSIPSGVIDVGDAFDRCTALTSVSIPASVYRIHEPVFEGCSSLTAIEVDPQTSSYYFSLEGVLFYQNDLMRGMHLVRFPAGRAGIYSMPEDVIVISDSALEGCAGLHSIIFHDNAPALNYPESSTFADTAPGFTIYYMRGSFDFTSPTWHGYPSVMIDPVVNPAAEWLLGHSLPYDTDLHQDLNGAGVSLLMAYALDLDPNLNLRASLPAPFLGAQDLSISFHGVSPGITYAAETSTNLMQWTTEGVILSPPDSFGQRTASVPRDDPIRFLRLKVWD